MVKGSLILQEEKVTDKNIEKYVTFVTFFNNWINIVKRTVNYMNLYRKQS